MNFSLLVLFVDRNFLRVESRSPLAFVFPEHARWRDGNFLFYRPHLVPVVRAELGWNLGMRYDVRLRSSQGLSVPSASVPSVVFVFRLDPLA